MCNWKHHIREINQTQKDKRCVLSLICGSYINFHVCVGGIGHGTRKGTMGGRKRRGKTGGMCVMGKAGDFVGQKEPTKVGYLQFSLNFNVL